MSFRPFSNGTEGDLWRSGNCDGGCVKAVDWSDPDKPFRCAIQSALSQATMTGEIPTRIADRAGFTVNGNRMERRAGYFPCREFNDKREPRTKRGPRRAKEQGALDV